MPLDFPTGPTNGEVYSGYVWNSTVGAWQIPDIGGSIEISPTAPTGPSDGDLWWDSDSGKLYIYYEDGTSNQWVDAAGPSVAVQSTPPTGYQGQLWLDSDDGSMYVYYDDGTSSQWIGAVSRPTTGTVLQVQQAFFNEIASTTSTSFVDVAIGATTFLSVSITPTKNDSKFLVMANVATGNSDNQQTVVRLLRNDGANSSVGNFNGGSDSFAFLDSTNNQSGTHMGSVSFLDSPSTPLPSSISYRVQYRATSNTSYINRARNSATRNGSSSLTVLEIGA